MIGIHMHVNCDPDRQTSMVEDPLSPCLHLRVKMEPQTASFDFRLFCGNANKIRRIPIIACQASDYYSEDAWYTRFDEDLTDPEDLDRKKIFYTIVHRPPPMNDVDIITEMVYMRSLIVGMGEKHTGPTAVGELITPLYDNYTIAGIATEKSMISLIQQLSNQLREMRDLKFADGAEDEFEKKVYRSLATEKIKAMFRRIMGFTKVSTTENLGV